MNLAPAFWPVNPAPSAYAIIAAQAAGGGDLAGAGPCALPARSGPKSATYAEDEVVRKALAEHGFDPAVADRGMLMAAETYAANLEEAVSRGVFGVPFYLVGSEAFWGQDRLDDLDAYLADAP